MKSSSSLTNRPFSASTRLLWIVTSHFWLESIRGFVIRHREFLPTKMPNTWMASESKKKALDIAGGIIHAVYEGKQAIDMIFPAWQSPDSEHLPKKFLFNAASSPLWVVYPVFFFGSNPTQTCFCEPGRQRNLHSRPSAFPEVPFNQLRSLTYSRGTYSLLIGFCVAHYADFFGRYSLKLY